MRAARAGEIRRRSRLVAVAASASGLLSCTMAFAQTLQQPPLVRYNPVGPGGVNVVTGGLLMTDTDLVAGTDGDPSKISLNRTMVLGGFGSMTPSTAFGAVAYGGYFSLGLYISLPNFYRTNLPVANVEAIVDGHDYKLSGPSGGVLDTSYYGDGASFRPIASNGSYPQFELRLADGRKLIFEKSTDYLGDEYGSILVKEIIYPDGSFQSFKYESLPFPAQTYLSKWANQPDITHRLTSIENSQGYGISFNYLNPNHDSTRDAAKMVISSAQSFRRICVTSSSCQTWNGGRSSYTYTISPIGYMLSTVTKSDGSKVSYSSNSDLDTIFIKEGDDATPAATYVIADVMGGYAGEEDLGYQVQWYSDALGHKTTYAIGNPTLVTLPDASQYTYANDYQPQYAGMIGNEPLLKGITDPLGHTTTYKYDANYRFVSVTYPEGNIASQVLDSRGNAIEIHRIPKPGSSESETVEYRSYPTCDDTNFAYCSKPSTEVDARGNQTNFYYDGGSGALRLIAYPADTAGLRRVTQTSFSNFAPADVFASASGVSIGQVRLATATYDCSAPASADPSGIDCTANPILTTRVLRTSSSSSSPSSFLVNGKEVIAGSVTRRTCWGLDSMGHVISETSARAQLAACN